MKTIEIDSTTIYVESIDAYAGSDRRAKERAAVKAILTEALGADTVLTHDAKGAPHVEGCNISISHSRRLAVVAIDPLRRIGIDAEEMRPTLRKVSSRFLSEREQSLFVTDQQLLAAWTIKEAVYKIVGRPAVEFATAIEISPDMRSAVACAQTYAIHPIDIPPTHITLTYVDGSD